MKYNIVLSIIIVHYRIKKELFACIRSIYTAKTTVPFEIIIVDNDEKKTIEKELTKTFPNIRYIKNPVNNGWGSGTNIGAAVAKGEYLYFLNPDTLVSPHAIQSNYVFMQEHTDIGVVSSLLLDAKRNPYPMQGTQQLTPFRAMIVYSFLNKRFPNNSISIAFWRGRTEWNKPFLIPVPPLSAALIRKDVFEKIGGFDQHYFLYFEEYDLAKRLSRAKYRNYINTDSTVVHFWEGSTKFRNDRNEIMRKSRHYYFQKHYGSFLAGVVDAWLLLPIVIKERFYGRMG